MSLDRAAPETRSSLRSRSADTSLGLVSLLCDARFNLTSGSTCEGSTSAIRAARLRSFDTRSGSDECGSKGVMTSRRPLVLPDTVDLTLSPRDVLSCGACG